MRISALRTTLGVACGLVIAVAANEAVAGPCPGPGDCCVANETPGCDDTHCCNAICAIDPFCCDNFWDGICADEAADDPVNCPQCIPPTGACCIGDGTCTVETLGDCSALGGTYQGDGTDCTPNSCPPPDECDQPFDHEVTQNADDTLIDTGGIACSDGQITTENSWARAYDLSVELPGKAWEINCVEFAMDNSGSFLTGVVTIYDDTDGGEPGSPWTDLVVLDSREFILSAGTTLQMFQVPFRPPVKLPPDSTIVVAVDLPPSPDGFAVFAGNSAGESRATYILSAPCGITTYIALGDIGFPDFHWVQTLRGVNQLPPSGASLDIKPGACPNSFNRSGHGVLPVALVGTDAFDVMEIDVSSVVLSRADGVGASVAPHEGPPGPHSEFEDVVTPFEGKEPCDCHELEGDGITDLSMKFKTDDAVEALELNDLPAGDLVQLVVNGTLLDGTPFSASDCIRIVPPGTPPGVMAVGSNLSGVFIDVTPLDETLDGGGFANFNRTFPLGSVVTLTAPQTHLGWVFAGWSDNAGVDGLTTSDDAGPLPDPSIDIIIVDNQISVEAI